MFLKHSRHDYRLQETAAGRRFLQTLRKSQEDYKERLNREGGASKEAEEGDEGDDFNESPSASSSSAPYRESSTSLWDTVDKDDTIELKSSLEKLIVEYLKKLSPEEDFETDEYSRLRRHLMDIVEPTLDKGTNVHHAVNVDEEVEQHHEYEEEDEDFEEYSSNEVATVTEGGSLRNSSEVEEFVPESSGTGETTTKKPKRRPKGRKGRKKCAHSRRVVSSLNSLEIEKALQNETEKEYNIRRIINYR